VYCVDLSRVITQGKPTQAMKEADSLEYGKLAAKDYIPGAEILRETSEVEQRQQQQGCHEFSLLFSFWANCVFFCSVHLLYD